MLNVKRVQIVVTLLMVIGGVVLVGQGWAHQDGGWRMADGGLEGPVFFIPHSAFHIPQSTSAWDGIYTEEQARRGAALYQQECASCHLATLTGGEQAPPLAGAQFAATWNGLTMGDLLERIRVTMPPDRPERLSRQQKADILAFMLSVHGFPVGKSELPRETHRLNQIRFEATKP